MMHNMHMRFHNITFLWSDESKGGMEVLRAPIKSAGFNILPPHTSSCVRCCSTREGDYLGSHRTLSSNIYSVIVFEIHAPGPTRPRWCMHTHTPGTLSSVVLCEFTNSIGFQDCSDIKCYGLNLLFAKTLVLRCMTCMWDLIT